MILAQNQKGDALTEVVAKSWLKEVGDSVLGVWPAIQMQASG